MTPRDGSDLGDKVDRDKRRISGGLRQPQDRDRKDSGNRRSVSFEDEVEYDRGRDKGAIKEREKVETRIEGENRRRERRRGEAKASIEVCS